jgi:hypothetical protein|tara:strand:- start:117 stop:311 length:195 start_codon:yes stop_codon:yes gene_type:complete
MSDLKQTIFQNILDKKFTKANKDFDGIMKDKVFSAVADYKKDFKYNPVDASEVEPSTPEDKQDG